MYLLIPLFSWWPLTTEFSINKHIPAFCVFQFELVGHFTAFAWDDCNFYMSTKLVTGPLRDFICVGCPSPPVARHRKVAPATHSPLSRPSAQPRILYPCRVIARWQWSAVHFGSVRLSWVQFRSGGSIFGMQSRCGMWTQTETLWKGRGHKRVFTTAEGGGAGSGSGWGWGGGQGQGQGHHFAGWAACCLRPGLAVDICTVTAVVHGENIYQIVPFIQSYLWKPIAMRITFNFNMGVAKLSCNKIVKACIPKRPTGRSRFL